MRQIISTRDFWRVGNRFFARQNHPRLMADEEEIVITLFEDVRRTDSARKLVHYERNVAQ